MASGFSVMAAAILAGGAVVTAAVLKPAPGPGAGRATVAQALEPLEARLAALEKDNTTLRRELESAQRQGAEAYGAAVDARRDVERLRGQNDDLLSMLDGLSQKAAPAAAAAASPTPATGGTTAPPLGSAPASSGSPDGTSPANVQIHPGEMDVVKAALTEIRKQEEDQQRAQRETQRKAQQDRRLADLKQRLGLTDGQVEAVGLIWEQTETKRRELMGAMRDGSGDRQEAMQAMEAVRAEQDTALQAALTPAQYTDYQKMQAERDQPRQRIGQSVGGGGGGRRGGGGGGGGR